MQTETRIVLQAAAALSAEADGPLGHWPCDCGKFAHITHVTVLRRLPPGYHGELCDQCKFWMCDLKVLAKPAIIVPEEPGEEPAATDAYLEEEVEDE